MKTMKLLLRNIATLVENNARSCELCTFINANASNYILDTIIG